MEGSPVRKGQVSTPKVVSQQCATVRKSAHQGVQVSRSTTIDDLSQAGLEKKRSNSSSRTSEKNKNKSVDKTKLNKHVKKLCFSSEDINKEGSAIKEKGVNPTSNKDYHQTTECETTQEEEKLASSLKEVEEEVTDNIDKMATVETQTKESWGEMMTQLQNMISASVKSSMEEVKRDWKQDLDEIKDGKTEILNSITRVENEYDAVEAKYQEVSGSINDLKDELKTCKEQIKLIMGTTSRHEHILQEMDSSIVALKTNELAANITIKGIEEGGKEEKCVELVQSFIQNKLKVAKAIKIVSAFRIGKGKQRPIGIKLKNESDKFVIFQHAKNIKDMKNTLNKKYQIQSYLPASSREAKKRKNKLMWTNSNPAYKLNMTRKRGEIFVDGIKYEKKVKTPSCDQIYNPSEAIKIAMASLLTTAGKENELGKSRFIGYTAVIGSIQNVNIAYIKVRRLHPGARHVMCGFRIPGREHHILQDFEDDSEHGGGALILDLLCASEIQNRVIFVVRYYDGTHEGPARFDAIAQAAKSAVTHAPYNHITNQHQCLWTKADGVPPPSETLAKAALVVQPTYAAVTKSPPQVNNANGEGPVTDDDKDPSPTHSLHAGNTPGKIGQPTPARNGVIKV